MNLRLVQVRWKGSTLILKRSVLTVFIDGLPWFMLVWAAIVLALLKASPSLSSAMAATALLLAPYLTLCRLGSITKLSSSMGCVAYQNYGIWRNVALAEFRGFRIEQVDSGAISETLSVPAHQRYYVVCDTIYGQTVRVSNLGVEAKLAEVRTALQVFNSAVAATKIQT